MQMYANSVNGGRSWLAVDKLFTQFGVLSTRALIRLVALTSTCLRARK